MLWIMAVILWLPAASSHAEQTAPFSQPPLFQTEELVLGSNLAGLLEYARKHNPEFAAMRHEADAAKERISPAANLPDPIFRTEWMDITNRGTDKGTSLLPSEVGSTRYLFMQNVPWFGKRALKRKAAEAGREQAEGRVTLGWAELSTQIKSAYAEAYYITDNQKITRELLDLVVQMEKVAQVRYANGLAAQQDAIRAQVEQTVIKTELITLGNAKRQIEARLNALLSRQIELPLATPEGLRTIPSAASLANRTPLEKRIRENNPDLLVNAAEIRSGEKNRDLVYKNRYPDFALGISPTQVETAVREWGVMVELNIPLQQETRRSLEREAEAMLSAAKARSAATANRLLSTLTENLSGIDAAVQTELLSSNGLLPQAKITFESALIGYQTGKVDFATLLDAARQILNAKLEVLKARVDGQMRLAEIERLLGEDL